MTYKLLSPAATKQWMRPAGDAGSYTMTVGAPWEIYRLSHITPDNRVIDVCTKSGSMPGYAAYLVFLPDYNVAGTITVAGDEGDNTATDLLDKLTVSAIAAMESLARNQAKDLYAGRYTGPCSGLACDPKAKSSLELAVDDGPGLLVKSWINNGKSMLDVLAGNKGVKPEDIDVRLYPIGEGDRWRMAVEKLNARPKSIRMPSEACTNWLVIDEKRYASYPYDEFQFVAKGGKVVRVKNPGLRSNLSKS